MKICLKSNKQRIIILLLFYSYTFINAMRRPGGSENCAVLIPFTPKVKREGNRIAKQVGGIEGAFYKAKTLQHFVNDGYKGDE